MNEETEGIIGSHYCPKWSRGCRVTAQDTEETERHWVSFKLTAIFFSNLLKSERAGRETCFSFIQCKTFSMSLCWAAMSSGSHSVSETQKGTLWDRAVMSDTTRTFLSRLLLLLLLNQIDSAYSECQSASTWFKQMRSVSLRRKRALVITLQSRARPSGTRSKIWWL